MTTENQNTVPENTPAVEVPGIGLADLQMAVKIIDHAADQGAFKGWASIQQVFAVRTKINNFVVASLPAEVAPTPAPKEEVKTPNRVTKSPAGAKASAAAKPVVKKTTKTK